jgi:hypothetical protein
MGVLVFYIFMSCQRGFIRAREAMKAGDAPVPPAA